MKQLLILLLSATLLSSCLRPAKEASEVTSGVETAADFKALEMTGESIVEKQNSVWKIPTKKTYKYKVCLISNSTKSSLPSGQEFLIQKSDKTSVMARTNSLGCLVWKEGLDFDYTSDSIYIEKKREVVGRGTYRGKIALRFAVNPWLQYRNEMGQEFIDLNQGVQLDPVISKSMMPELVTGERAGMFSRSSGHALLIEEKPSVKIRPIKDIEVGKRLEIIFDSHPFIEPLNLNQEKVQTKLTSGKYKVYVQLIANYLSPAGNKSVILTPELEPQSIEVQSGGLLRFQKSIELKNKVTMGRVELAIKIVPEDAPFELSSFEGLYDIGDFRNIYSAGWITQVRGGYAPQAKAFDYSNFITKEVSNYDEMLKADWVQKLPPVNYDHLNPRFVRVKGEEETSTERTIIYRVSTRVTDSVTGAAVINQKFKITREDGEEIEVSSNHNGLLHWTNTIHHHYYQPEQFYLKKVVVTHLNSKKSETYTLALNPWDSGWTFGMDARDRENGFSDAELGQSEKLLPPLLMVDAFRYQTIRFRYVIDEFLTLNVKKAVVMALDPLVQKQTINRGRQFEPLRDGIYLAKIALVKYYIDPFKQGVQLLKDEDGKHSLHQVREGKISKTQDASKGEYTSIIKKLIRVQAGRITTPLEFSMRDLRMMSIRSNIMVQLETIDEKLLLEDNIINEKLSDFEQRYNEYHCLEDSQENCMNNTDRTTFRAKMEEEKRQGLKDFQSIIGKHLLDLKKQRVNQAKLMAERDAIVKGLEDGLANDSQIKSIYGETSIFDLPQGEAKELLERARESLSSLARRMQNYWGDWDENWISRTKKRAPDDGQLLTIAKSQYEMLSEQRQDERKVLEKKSYEAYLANMQLFLKDLHPDLTLTQKDIESFKRNNYRENPAVPLVDLNLYRNGDVSGLKSRTFIGPCTLVENDNMSELRPTDTIDEGECWGIACHDRSDDAKETVETVDNSEFENSAYHDSLIPFTNSTVDDFVEDHRRNERSYKKKMLVVSQMGNFVTAYNMDFVSLKDESLQVYDEECRFDEVESYQDCFKESKDNVMASDYFVTLLQGEEFEDLLQRYFFINPLGRQKVANDKVDRLRREKDSESLEPLFPRANYELGRMFDFSSSKVGSDRGYDERLLDGVGGHSYQFERWKFLKDYYNEAGPAKIDKKRVKKWLNEGRKGLSLEDSLSLCQALATHVVNGLEEKDMLGEASWLSTRSAKENSFHYLRDKCFENVKYMPNQDEIYLGGIAFDRRYKILETGSYRHMAGKNMNLNVGIDFGIVGYGDSQTVASVGLNGIAIVGAVAAGIGAVASAPIVAGVGGLIAATAIFSGSINSAKGTMDTTSTSVNAATFLVVQQADMEITIEKHLKCLSTQYSDELVSGFDLKALGIKDDVAPKSQELHRTLTRGFFICDDEVTNEPELITENYYYVTQHFTAGDMLDDVNLLNHVWLLALRGKRDFNTFLRAMKGRKIGREGQDGEVIDEINLYDYSLDRLGDVYNQVKPTFPGMYSAPN